MSLLTYFGSIVNLAYGISDSRANRESKYRGGKILRSESEVRNQLEKLLEDRLSGLPYTELKSIAWHGTKQALEWVLEETEQLLSY